MSRSRVFIAILFVSSAAVFAGCKSEAKRYGVSGTVKYKGTPIRLGTISFIPEGGTAPAGGAAIKDGAYEIAAAQGLPPGKYLVSVSYPDPKGAAPAPTEDEAPGASREVKELLPDKYNGATELRAEVKAGEPNEFPFDLK